MKLKKVLCLMLVLAVCVGAVCVPVSAEITLEDYGFTFTEYDELIDLLDMARNDLETYYDLWFMGEGPLVFYTDLLIPRNVRLDVVSADVVIPEGITLELVYGGWFGAKSLTVEGTYINGCSTQVPEFVSVSGKIYNNGTIHLGKVPRVEGEENVIHGYRLWGEADAPEPSEELGSFSVGFSAVDQAEFLSAVKQACEKPDYYYNIDFYWDALEPIVLTEDLTIPENAGVIFANPKYEPVDLIVEQGVTVTNQGYMEFYGENLVYGTLVNQGSIDIQGGGSVELKDGGKLSSGQGSEIWIQWATHMGVEEALIGVDLSGYQVQNIEEATCWYVFPGAGGGDDEGPGSFFGDVKEEDYFFVPVMWAVESGITVGTGEGTFSPDEKCTRAQVVTFLWRSQNCPAPKSSENPFTDVKEDDWFYEAVLWAVENNITLGVGGGKFGTEEVCTRAQVATFLWRAAGNPEAKGTNPFTDVKTGDYFFAPVLWAVSEGVTMGTSDTTFGPEEDCTRGQIVTFLFRAIEGE